MSTAGAASVEHRPGLGLVSLQHFSVGDVVVVEQPLLHVPMLKPSHALSKPLQEYFVAHGVPPSVVLKVLAAVTADDGEAAAVLRQGFCPDPAAYAGAAVVRQARAFATALLAQPPVPEFAAAAARAAAADGSPDAADAPQSLESGAVFDLLVRLQLMWVLHAHSFKQGSALLRYASQLTHTCGAPNTAFVTPAGDVVNAVQPADGGSGSSGERQLPAAAAAAAAAVRAGAPGVHVALRDIAAGAVLTTNYLGLGHRRLMSTPARQKLLADRFLFQCACSRCTQEPDLARGLPCPACSGEFRGEDKLLLEDVALAAWQLGQPVMAAAAGAHTGRCGFVYCNMPLLLSGAAEPWHCDSCGAAFSDDTLSLLGKFYSKGHATVEQDMVGWVTRLDASMDASPLVREPRVLHERVLGVLRLLGPHHWACWRLLLLGVELHCGAIEEAVLRIQVQRSKDKRQGSAASGDDAASGEQQAPHEAAASPQADAVTQPAVWLVRYCSALWAAVSAAYGELEAGQLLGFHFTEATQVLLQAASSTGLLPRGIDAALQLQAAVLPGLRSVCGADYNPLAQLLGSSVDSGGGGLSVQAVAAHMQRQQQARAAEAANMRRLVADLRRLES